MKNYVLHILFSLSGLTFFLVGIVMAYNKYTFMNSNLEKVEGTVVDFVYGNKGTVAPVIEYRTKNGLSLLYKSNFFISPPKYQKGEKLMLYYKVGNATEVCIDSFIENWLFSIAFVLSGLFGIVVSLYQVKMTRRDIENHAIETAP